MSLVSAVIDRVQDRFPDLDDTRGLVLALEAHREILTRCQLRNKAVDISLTAGTREYNWDETDLKVWETIYFASSTDEGTIIQPTSTDELDIYIPGWRGMTTRGTPRYTYFTSATDTNTAKQMVGFHDIPDTTTSTYPIARFYCTSYAALTTSDVTPPQLISDQVYFDRMCYLWCKDFHRDEVQFWDQMSEREIERNVQHVNNTLRRRKSSIYRTWMSGRSIV